MKDFSTLLCYDCRMKTPIYFFLSLVTLLSNVELFGQESETKNRIEALSAAIATVETESERALLGLELSKQYYADQQQEKAFLIFLKEVLRRTPASTHRPTGEEKAAYATALKLYLTAHSNNIIEVSRNIIDTYNPILKECPDFHELGYIVAAAHANLGDFQNYFDLHFTSYNALSNHYLAHKGKAILHLKLFERYAPGNDKEIQRDLLLKELAEAASFFLKILHCID